MRHPRFFGRAGALLAVFLSGNGCGSSPAAPSPAPPPAATRDGRFVQDVDALATDLPRLHVNLFFQVSRATFEGEAATLKSRVAELQDHEIVAGLMRLAALPGDAHTAISPFAYAGFRRLPVRLRYFSDGLLVTAATPAGAPLLGRRVTRLGDLAEAEALARVRPVISTSNEAWLRAIGPNYLVIPELLHAQRVVASPEQVRIAAVGMDGSVVEAVLAPATDGAFTEVATAGVPLHRQRNTENYWFTRTADDVVYLQYNRCQNAAADPMTSFARRLFDEVDRVPPRALVVDLRANGGGDSSVLEPVLQGLRSRRHLVDSRRLFVLIGNATYSSALLNAITLKRQIGAVLVGEPTGGRPNGYGETRSFTLPNSGLVVSYSTKYFASWPDGDPASLFPDVEAALSSADHLAGRDPAMEAVARLTGGA